MPLISSFNNLHKYILPLGFAGIIGIMIVISLTAILQIKVGMSLIIDTTRQHYINTELLNDMSQAAFERSILLSEMIHTNDPFEVDELYLRFNEAATKFAVSRLGITSQTLNPALQKLLEQQGLLSEINAPLQNQVHELIQQEKIDSALTLFISKTIPTQRTVLNIINQMIDYELSATLSTHKSSIEHSHKTISTILLFDLAGILFSIFLAVYISKKQKRNDNELSLLATTDTLTELPNRASFIDNINTFIKKNKNTTAICAIIFFDIDYFKSINDNYGHDAGDEVLKEFSNTVKSSIKSTDILSRFGGDEFVLLLRSINSEEEAINFIRHLSNKLDTSFTINNNKIFITSSIGVSLFPQNGNNAKTLLKNADIAMYTAKESGRNCYRFFSKETSKKMSREHSICHALHSTLKTKNTELTVLYQPLLNIKNGNMTECEALLRWKNAEGEYISPKEFIPLAEKNNLIEAINLFVIEQACLQQHQWKKLGICDIRININLSGNKMIFTKLINALNNNLQTLNLDPSLFGIELTEKTLYEITQETTQQLENMKKTGVKISIDDFGIGYSSLSALKQLPITTLKIDKDFIAGLPNDKDDHTLVKTIITLGHSLDLDIVAEGVETSEQLSFLKTHNCNIVQGYYFHPPLDSQQIVNLKLAA